MKFVKNFLTLGALVALFSQSAYGQMPGTFSPVGGVAGVSAVPDCTGGTWSYAGGKTIHTFTFNDTLVCPTPRTANYLAVGGGGGSGGASYSGGGGAGGFLQGSTTIPAGTTTINVGPGGIGGPSGQRGGNGGNSQIIVPGGAGSWVALTPTYTPTSAGAGFAGNTPRTRWTTPVYLGTVPPTSTQLRVTVGNSAAGATFGALWCGHAPSGSASNTSNYDGNQVQIKFSGNGNLTVPTTPVTSDAVNFSFDKTKDLICAYNQTSSATATQSSPSNTVWSGYEAGAIAGSNSSLTLTQSAQYGYITLIEVFSTSTIIANALGGTGGASYSSFINALSGGGSAGGSAYSGTTRATGTAGQGNSGGINAVSGCGAGGGGAGAQGGDCTSPNGGIGGAGLQSAITGTMLWYAAGGGGGPYTGTGGTGGSGIGGIGGNYSPATSCTPGAANTGSGAGGIASTGICPGADGVVVVSYPTGITIPPPTCTPNTAGGGTFANVMALWHFDNTLTDSSGRGHTGTIVGTGSLSAAQSKFGGYSYLNGTGASYFSTPGSTDFNMRTGDFTVEGWSYNTTNVSGGFWGSSNTSNGGDWTVAWFSAATTTSYIGSTSYSPTWSYTRPLNTWTHYAWTRQSGTMHFFVNGKEITPAVTGMVGDINPSLADARIIGSYAASASYPWVGYMDEFRVSNMARYTGNFAPQTVPFCNN